jgi:outer membrane protein
MIYSIKKLCTISLLIQISLPVFSQELLTLDEAIALGLKNNYSIQVARINADTARIHNFIGNAGMLPSVNLSATGKEASNKMQQDYATPNTPELQKSGVHSDALAYGANLNWTLFDGFNMFATLKELQVFQDMGDINAKIAIETTVSSIIDVYFDVIRQKELAKNIKDAIKIYDEKLTIADKKFNLGSGSRLDFLQSKVDLNVQKTNLIKQNTNLSNSKASLNQLLSRNEDTDFNVPDSIPITYMPSLDELRKTIFQQNTSLQLSEKNIRVFELTLKQYQSLRYPNVSVGLGYNFSKTDNAAGPTLLNQNTGFGPSFTIAYNIFNGFTLNHFIRNAKLNIQSANFEFNDTKLQVSSNLLKAYRTYQTDLEALKLIEENYDLAKETVTVALERYRLGASSALDLSVAQQSYEDAQNAVILARYDAKVAETELMLLNGQLVR